VKRRRKEGETGRGAFIAVKRIFRRASLAARTFGETATELIAKVVRDAPDWLNEFFEAEPLGAANLLDPSNPDRDLFLGATDGAGFDDGYYSTDYSGPSLDLG
jgi:hypothetical protein